MTLGNLQLLLLKVAAYLYHLHAVHKCGMDGGEGVCRGNEHHLRQIESGFQIVVVESAVLLRIQNLQHGGGWIALYRHAGNLVNFVQHKDRVGGSGLPKKLYDPSRHRTDVCLAVAADLRLVMQAAQRHPDVLAPHSGCDRLAQRCLSDTRRTNQTQYRRLHVTFQLQHS